MPHTTDEKMWGARLVAVNAAGQLFIMHIEAQISLAAVGMALLAQSLIYQRKRFICLFEVTHIIWVPMLAWIALRLPRSRKRKSRLRPGSSRSSPPMPSR